MIGTPKQRIGNRNEGFDHVARSIVVLLGRIIAISAASPQND